MPRQPALGFSLSFHHPFNRAGGCTSNVGQETKMPILSTYVNSNFGGSISSEEADQLAFAVFCSLDYLPEIVRAEIWDRARIASEFASLAQEGYIAATTSAHEIPDYWSATIDRFLSGKLVIDYDFRARLKQ